MERPVPTFLRSRSNPNPNPQPNPTPDPSALPFVRPAPDADITPADIPRPLTASALKVNVNDAALMSKLRSATVTDRIWQRRAWQGYESTGEVYFAFNLIGNLVSRIRFYPAADVAANAAPAYVQDASDLTPGLAEAAEAALRRISRHGSMSTLARDMAVNFNVVGECYLVQTPQSVTSVDGVLTPAPESWDIRSIDEVVIPSATPPSSSSTSTRSSPASDSYRVGIRTTPGAVNSSNFSNSSSPSAPSSAGSSLAPGATTYLPKDAFVARMWRRSPRFSSQAESSMRGVLDLIDELTILNQTFRATARSRLNNGILFVPDGISASAPPPLPTPYPTTPTTPTPPPDTTTPQPPVPDLEAASLPAPEDTFEETLIEAMLTPLSDPSGASSVVPILVRGPGELGALIKTIQIERIFDPALTARAAHVMDRILIGLDLPKEVVAGISDLKYANSIVVEDTLFRAHIEPLILLICDAITEVYLRPALQAVGFTLQQAQRVRVWYDPSAVVARPNRAQDAINAYDRFSLSSRSLREASGFNEDDAPTPTELILRMLLQKGPISPELSESLMRSIAPLFMEATRQATAASSDNPLPPEVQSALGLPGTAPTAPSQDAAPAAPAADLIPPTGVPAVHDTRDQTKKPGNAPPTHGTAPTPGTSHTTPTAPSATPTGPHPAHPAQQTPNSSQVPLLPPTPQRTAPR
jgi:hypothetical protein